MDVSGDYIPHLQVLASAGQWCVTCGMIPFSCVR
jgi:hypothetical protein